MERTPWIDRRFSFGLPPGWMPNVLERLRGTSPRLNELLHGLSPERLKARPAGKWSIQEHVGHLIDLEVLHEGRIDDLLANATLLRGWDTTNSRTNNAGHNDRDITGLLDEFQQGRDHFAMRLAALDDATQERQALHPRLQLMMRPVDLAFFVAEHDDHHLATIRTLMR